MFAEGVENGYFVKRPNGDVWQWDMWQPGMALVDFTNPAACKWFQDKLEILMDMGVDCFKTDFGERIPLVGFPVGRQSLPGPGRYVTKNQSQGLKYLCLD